MLLFFSFSKIKRCNPSQFQQLTSLYLTGEACIIDVPSVIKQTDTNDQQII